MSKKHTSSVDHKLRALSGCLLTEKIILSWNKFLSKLLALLAVERDTTEKSQSQQQMGAAAPACSGRPPPLRSSKQETACANRSIPHSSPVFYLLCTTERVLYYHFVSWQLMWLLTFIFLLFFPIFASHLLVSVASNTATQGVSAQAMWLLTITVVSTRPHWKGQALLVFIFLFIQCLTIILSENKDNTLQLHSRSTTLQTQKCD